MVVGLVGCTGCTKLHLSFSFDGTAQFKLLTCMQIHTCECTFTACKTSKTGMCMHSCTQFWHVCMWDSEHTRHRRDAHHELALGLPHYTCGVTTGTVSVGNEIQLLCS